MRTVELKAGPDGIALAALTFGVERCQTACSIIEAANADDRQNINRARYKIACNAAREAINMLELAIKLVQEDDNE